MFDDLIGKTYEQVGRCFGLCRIVCGRLGINLPDWTQVCADQAADMIERCKPGFVPVTGAVRPGDLVHIVNFDGPPHVAVVVAANTVMQVTSGHCVHRMGLDNIWIKTRIAGIYRYAA